MKPLPNLRCSYLAIIFIVNIALPWLRMSYVLQVCFTLSPLLSRIWTHILVSLLPHQDLYQQQGLESLLLSLILVKAFRGALLIVGCTSRAQ